MLHMDALVDSAQAKAGLSDFGSDSWRTGLERLVRSINEEAALNELGEQVLTEYLTGKLICRLQMEDWFRRYPEIAEQEVAAPIFGLGLPRTGSTALGVMLGQDPARRSLRTWEAEWPCPPPETATQDSDPRIAPSQAALDALVEMFPDYAGMLPISALAPTECLLILSLDFRSMDFEARARVDSYNQWLLDGDMEPGYRYHKRVLQLLQWRCPPNRWFLRTPAHSPSIATLDRVYPDARFVMTHREIGRIIPSLVALISALSASLTRRHDPAKMARDAMDFWEVSLKRLLAFRDAGNEHRFFDIDFAEFQAAPMEPIRRFYDWLGEPLTEEAERRMIAWWQQHAETRQPSKRHSAAELGVSEGEMAERFAFYNDRFAG